MAELKWSRNYQLLVQTATGDTITVNSVKTPLTVEFDITRNFLTSANVAQIKILNLSPTHRNLIRKDVTDYGSYRLVNLFAGYGSNIPNLPLLFAGSVTSCYSAREGQNFVTTIECLDGGFAFVNGSVSQNFPANTPWSDVVTTLISEGLPNVATGYIGSLPGSLVKGNSFTGNTMDILREITGGAIFIDRNLANVLSNAEYIADASTASVTLINSQSGLLGTPIRQQYLLTFDMILEPRLIIGQRVFLESMTDQNFNGYYKVSSVKHRGIISPVVSGEAITSVQLVSPSTLIPVQRFTTK